jgi:hypothetical protein
MGKNYVSQLEGNELDYWAAKGVNLFNEFETFITKNYKVIYFDDEIGLGIYSPTTNPDQCAALIRDYEIDIRSVSKKSGENFWAAFIRGGDDGNAFGYGDTFQVAAVRSFLIHKFGDKVDAMRVEF